jgi:tight adherence protein C
MFFDTLIQGLFSPLGMVVILAVTGASLVVGVIVALMRTPKDPFDKLRDSRDPEAPSLSRETQRKRSKNLDRYAAFLEPKDVEQLTAARQQMIQAGYHSKTAVRDFHAVQFILAMGFLLVGLGYTFFLTDMESAGPVRLALQTLVPTLVGYYIPRYWVEKRRGERQEQIVRGFPDALDMLLICVEAGQSLDQSIMRVSKELAAGYPALAEELATVARETKAGKDRIEVLKDMGERCGVTDIRSFVTVLAQSSTYGTPIAEALRVYAGEMRDKRVMTAEEKANVLPTKLTLGTMMFTVPPLLIILIGPSVHGIMVLMSEANFGG